MLYLRKTLYWQRIIQRMIKYLVKEFIRKLRLVKIRTRLIIAVILVSLAPLLVFAGYSLKIYTNSLQTKVAQTYEHSTQLIGNELASVFTEYSAFITTVSVEPSIQNYLSDAEKKESYENFKFSREMVQYFSDVSTPLYPATVYDVFILDRNGEVVFDRGHFLLTAERRTNIIRSTDNFSPNDCLIYISDVKDGYVSISRKIFDKGLTGTPIGYIVLMIDAGVINQVLLSDIATEEEVDLLITDSLGFVISSTDPGEIGNSVNAIGIPEESLQFGGRHTATTKNIRTRDSIFVSTFNPKYNSFALAVVPQSIFRKESRNVIHLVTISLIILLVVTLSLTLIIYLSILSPINSIISVYGKPRTDLEHLRVRDSSSDELGQLSRTIDTMADENAAMIKQINEDDKKKRELELEALKYQINPHFLFNTLNTFKWIASVNNVISLKNGIDSLTYLLKKTIVDQNEFVPLEEEIQCLKDYCTIQEMRFAGRFDMHYDLSDSISQYLVPRFILQPLVENSILHGTEDNDDTVTISVTGRGEDGRLLLTVSDDGKGFNVKDIMDEKGIRFNGIGLSNVASRLRLHYGDSAELRIESRPFEGTRCLIILPEEKNHRSEEVHV